MGYLIDTCLISELRRSVPSESVKTWFQTCEETQLFISVLTIGEIKYGIQRLANGKKKEELQKWFNQVIDSFSNRVLPITQHICITWAIMRSTAENNGLQLSVIDGLLAATAKENNLILVTRNIKDFEPTNINIVNPWNS